MLGAAVFFPSANHPPSLIARRFPPFTSPNLKNSKTFLNVRASLTDFPLASRIIVRNLSYSTNEINLKKEFSNFGEVVEAGFGYMIGLLTRGLRYMTPRDNFFLVSARCYYVSIVRFGTFKPTLVPGNPKVPHYENNFVKLVKDESGKRSKGYAFIQYTSQDDAMLAVENLDCRYIDGRTVFLEIAKPSRNSFGRYPRTSGPPPTMQDSS